MYIREIIRLNTRVQIGVYVSHAQSVCHISLLKDSPSSVKHDIGCILANTRPHQLSWSDREMGTAILCERNSLGGCLYPIIHTRKQHLKCIVAVFVCNMVAMSDHVRQLWAMMK